MGKTQKHVDIASFFKAKEKPSMAEVAINAQEEVQQENVMERSGSTASCALDIKDTIVSIMDEWWKDKLRNEVKNIVVEILETDPRFKSKTRASKKANASLSKFGQEDYKYMLIPYLSSMINTIPSFTNLLQKVIYDLYFNPDHKNNHIIYIPPDSVNSITVYKDPGSWGNYELIPTLEQIIRRANDILQHYMVGVEEAEENRFKELIGDVKYTALIEFTDKIDNMEADEEFRKKLLKETEHTIVTSQHLVHRHIYDPPPHEERAII